MRVTDTSTAVTEIMSFKDNAIACLLVVYSSQGATTVDRCKVHPLFIVGRGSNCDLTVNDSKVSKQHFRITETTEGYWIEDLESKNGTFVNGIRLTLKTKLPNPSVIRAGETIFVFHQNAESVLEPFPEDRLGISGDFHAGPLIREISAAVLSERHMLLVGPSGAGKELVARGVASYLRKTKPDAPFVVHNAAKFSSEEEATVSLFGVGSKVFSDVVSRAGLIEQAQGGILFLDEVHNLPERVQRTLLRIIEDGELSRIGETTQRKTHVRFLLASNAPEPTYGLAHDLLSRLRLLRVPSLKDRVADIPSIFDVILEKIVIKLRLNFQSAKSFLYADHYEAMCLDGFVDENVRGMIAVADKLATYMATGILPQKAVSKTFSERFQNGPVLGRSNGKQIPNKMGIVDDVPFGLTEPKINIERSNVYESSCYERHKSLIIDAYEQSHGNVSETNRLLKSQGIKCSRRWLDIFLDKWGVERRRYKPRG